MADIYLLLQLARTTAILQVPQCTAIAFASIETGKCAANGGSKGRPGWAMPPRFLAAPCSHPRFVLNFTFKFVWLTYTADNFQSAKFLTIWRLSGEVLTIFTSLCWVLIRLAIANQSSLQRNITMQERHLCWPAYFFPWPRSGPPVFSF